MMSNSYFNSHRNKLTFPLSASTSLSLSLSFVLLLLLGNLTTATAQDEPAFESQIAPLLTHYCSGCHNDVDAEGGLALDSVEGINKGGDHGPIVLPNQAAESLLIQVIKGTAEPKMPPDGEPAPTPEEIELLVKWISDGAEIADGESMRPSRLVVPTLEPAKISAPRTAMDWSPSGTFLAEATFQTVTLTNVETNTSQKLPITPPGKINSLQFSDDGKLLVIATGITGLKGRVLIWDVAKETLVKSIDGHRDVLYAAVISPDQKWLATAGYDQVIMLWDLQTEQIVHRMTGHNDAIYSLAFDPSSQILVSASGDETVKAWRVRDGMRLDTMGQPTAEQYACLITPDGRYVVGGGADNRIRVWRLLTKENPQINPLQLARFGHEGAISHLALSIDGSLLVTASEDKTIKVWETATWSEVQLIEQQSDVISSIAFSPSGSKLRVALMNGAVNDFEIVPTKLGARDQPADITQQVVSVIRDEVHVTSEQEPNNSIKTATEIKLPAQVTGTIQNEEGLDAAANAGEDLYRFEAGAGEQWIFEINAARSGSPLDSHIEILDESGEPVLRVLLQAVRDSYYTFRGKDSNTSDDFRVFNWQEMELNEFLYSDGEVVRLWLYPRGPDSGYKVYPGFGNRHTFFDTTAVAHALQAPCYIVQPLAPGSTIVPTGLPVFPIYFENDDESKRQLGKDSKLTFTAPKSGTYYIRVRDSRGFSGEQFKYTLTSRSPRPDFEVSKSGFNTTIHPGAGREFTVTATREDGFNGEIRIDVAGLPPGFHVSSPIVIQEGQFQAVGVVWADENAPAPTAENQNKTTIKATASIGGSQVSKNLGSLGSLQLGEAGKQILPRITLSNSTDQKPAPGSDGLLTIKIRPGETTTALVKVDRNGFNNDLGFGKEDSGRNLPHGIIVDNIGLSGLLIPANQTEQLFFLTAADWVPPQKRLLHLRTEAQGGQCSVPVWLEVVALANGQSRE